MQIDPRCLPAAMKLQDPFGSLPLQLAGGHGSAFMGLLSGFNEELRLHPVTVLANTEQEK